MPASGILTQEDHNRQRCPRSPHTVGPPELTALPATLQELLIDAGLKEVAKYADALGPDKGSLVPLIGGKAVYTTDLATRWVGALLWPRLNVDGNQLSSISSQRVTMCPHAFATLCHIQVHQHGSFPRTWHEARPSLSGCRVHKAGMQLHPYTFRNEPVFFANNFSPSTIESE